MAKTQAQTTTGRTRIKNGLSVTLYAAASKGKEGTLGGVASVGAGLEPGLIIAVPTNQTANALQIEQPEGTIIAGFDPNGGLITSGATKVAQYAKRVTLTAAQITTLHSVPVALVAAPGAGIALVCQGFIFQFTFGTVQFTGGGTVQPVYHSATTNLAAGSVAAATVQAAANYTGYSPAAAGGTALALSTNSGIDLYAASADFAAGDSTAVVTIFYDVLTLG